MSKILSKDYPYIIGVSPNMEDIETYSTLLTVKLIISRSKLEEYFKQKTSPHWGEFWRFSNLFHPSPDPNGLIIEEIKRLGRMFYEVIGDEHQFETAGMTVKYRTVKINSFLLDDTN
jgi:hypothetical protein